MIVRSDVFKSAMNLVAPAVSARINRGMLIEATDDQLTLSGVGEATSVKITIPCRGSLDPTLVTPDALRRVVSAAITDDFSITRVDQSLEVKAHRSKLKLPILELSDFISQLEPSDDLFSAPLDISSWVNIKRVRDATKSSKVLLEAMRALHVSLSPTHSLAIATDGFLLLSHSLAPTDFELKFAVANIAIAPFVQYLELACQVPTQIAVHRGQIFLKSASAFASFALISGTLPPYEKFFNFNPVAECVISRKALKNSLQVCGSFADDETRRVDLSMEGNSLRLNAESGGHGQFSEDIPVESVVGSLESGYRLTQWVSALSGGTSEKITLKTAQNGSAYLYEPGFIALLQPLR